MMGDVLDTSRLYGIKARGRCQTANGVEVHNLMAGKDTELTKKGKQYKWVPPLIYPLYIVIWRQVTFHKSNL